VKRFSGLLVLVYVAAISAIAVAQSAGKVVDSGTFSISVQGKKVATETFRIEQRADGSVTHAQLKVEDETSRANLTSEMYVGANGDLRRYKWQEVSGKGSSVLEPQNEFLIERFTDETGKAQEMPYVLPLATVVLDDNFFSHRQLLAWRYLATGCLQRDGRSDCGKFQFGIIIPRQHAPSTSTMEYAGKQKTQIKGKDTELHLLKLTTDGSEWSLWMDDQYRVQRMQVPASGVDVVRE
jgi:hypothetical protein